MKEVLETTRNTRTATLTAMRRQISRCSLSHLAHTTGLLTVIAAMFCIVQYASAQDTPVLSGGVGFFSNTNAGNTSLMPLIEPVLALPIGDRFLVESRATLVETFTQNGNGQSGLSHSHFVGLSYLQADYIVSPHLTFVAGYFLTPFGTFNERLAPIWINNLQSGPLIGSLGLMGSGSGLGGMVRGSAISRRKYSVEYAGYYSTRSANEQFNSERSTGGRVSLYVPDNRLEVGVSYGRSLQGTQKNFYGSHVWWEPKDTGLRLRSEFARGHHAQGYWIEADYRLKNLAKGPDSWLGRLEPVFRMQQTFRRDTIVSDTLPLVNAQRADFGLDYNMPHNTRILTSYSRQFSSAGNFNVWQAGIVYRFLFPAWKGQ